MLASTSPCLVLVFHCILLHCAASFSTNITSHSPYVSDVCDWQGSGSPSVDSERSVVPIYLRCSRGSVEWLYPKGGLRVVLKLGTSNKNFHGCIRVARNSTQNVRIYIEGKRQLHQIYSADDGKHKDLLRCFVSVDAFMAIFIETEPSSDSLHSSNHIIFNYDLQATTTSDNELEDCKPCSDTQILSLFCSGDFALSGKVTYFHNRPEIETTEFYVKPTFIYRFPSDSAYISDFNTSAYYEFDNQNRIEDVDSLSQITLQRPLKCASEASGRTEYLFLGRKVLGNYFITCALKLNYWKRISKKAIETGTNQCHMT